MARAYRECRPQQLMYGCVPLCICSWQVGRVWRLCSAVAKPPGTGTKRMSQCLDAGSRTQLLLAAAAEWLARASSCFSSHVYSEGMNRRCCLLHLQARAAALPACASSVHRPVSLRGLRVMLGVLHVHMQLTRWQHQGKSCKHENT